jgi:hypothetical protein
MQGMRYSLLEEEVVVGLQLVKLVDVAELDWVETELDLPEEQRAKVLELVERTDQ